MEAISHAGTVLGVLSKDGVVLAAEKKVTGKLLDMSGAKEGGYGGSGEKIFLLNSCVPHLSPAPFSPYRCSVVIGVQKCGWRGRWDHRGRELARELRTAGGAKTSVHVQRRHPRRAPRATAM